MPRRARRAAVARLPGQRLCRRTGDEHPAARRERPGEHDRPGAVRVERHRPPNSQDQLGKYDNLLYGHNGLADSGLSKYYNDESFGVRPADITRTEHPNADVTIYRDKHDVPHIYGNTDQSAAFGAGYAQAEDRLFLMDVLRHYGEGTLAQFLGSSCAFEQMDHDQLLLAPYTKARAVAQVDALPKEYGKQGALAKSMIYAYVDGVNAYIAAAKTNPSCCRPTTPRRPVAPPTGASTTSSRSPA